MTNDVVKSLTGIERDASFALCAWGWREINELYSHLDIKPPSWGKYLKDQEIHQTTEERLLGLLRKRAAEDVDSALSLLTFEEARAVNAEYVLCRFAPIQVRAKYSGMQTRAFIEAVERAKQKVQEVL